MTTTLNSDNHLSNISINRQRHFHYVVELFQPQDFLNTYSHDLQMAAWNSFMEQLKLNENNLNSFNLEDLVVSFYKMLNTLLSVNATAIHVQVTSVNSLAIKAETGGGNIYTELFFDEITGWMDKVVVNIFHNQQLEFNNCGTLDEMTLSIKHYFGNEEMNYFTILNQSAAYDIPGRTFATIEF